MEEFLPGISVFQLYSFVIKELSCRSKNYDFALSACYFHSIAFQYLILSILDFAHVNMLV